ncbi:MAG: hypothetical protein ABFD50_15440 [Smithella sp.]
MKFKIGDVVYYMGIGSDEIPHIHQATITSLCHVENKHEDWASTQEQKQTWTPFGQAGNFYATCHGVLPEERLFATPEEVAEAEIKKIHKLTNPVKEA